MQPCSKSSEKITIRFHFSSQDRCIISFLIREDLDIFFGFQIVWRTSSDLQRNLGNATNGLPNKLTMKKNDEIALNHELGFSFRAVTTIQDIKWSLPLETPEFTRKYLLREHALCETPTQLSSNEIYAFIKDGTKLRKIGCLYLC